MDRLYVKLSHTRLLNVLGIRRQRLAQHTVLTTELIHNLRAPPSVQTRIEHVVQIAPDRLEELGRANAINEVVLLTLVLDVGTGLVGQDTDLLVGFLARLALCYESHDDGFCDHEGEFFLDACVDALGVDDEAGGDVVEGEEDGVGEEEHLGDVDAADGAVVECTLHPLVGEGVGEG